MWEKCQLGMGTRGYAKHLAALVIKQMLRLTYREIVEFLSKNDIGKILNYKQEFHNLLL